MSRAVEAKLYWLSAEEGGRKSLPTGPRYSTIARFANQQKPLSEEAWSLVAEFRDPPDQTRSRRVLVRFLFDGPEHLLKPSETFELLEGERVVARGTFI
jgi:hypothetical protein